MLSLGGVEAPHERPIHEVARDALAAEIRAMSQRLQAQDYWRPRRLAQAI